MSRPPSSSKLDFFNLEEIEEKARAVLPKQVFGYYSSGSESESTVRFNREAFGKMRLLPRMLVDVSNTDTSVELLGRKLDFPVLIAPMAMQRMAHTDGELATARAAAKFRIPMVQSTMGTIKLQEVIKAGRDAPLMMFQLYVLADREFTQNLIQDAEKVGYNALVVTVDAPHLGNREADERNSFQLPEGMTLENLLPLKRKADEMHKSDKTQSGIAAVFSNEVDASLTWKFVDWVRTVTRLPIFVKGVLSPADATRAADAGVDGVIVSNHGGRQVDYAPAAVDMLPPIAEVLRGRGIPVLVDGGIRRGTDIIKALALGANAVLVGRPIVYGLALGGQEGVERVLGILKKEFKTSLALMGCPTVHHLNKDVVLQHGETYSRL